MTYTELTHIATQAALAAGSFLKQQFYKPHHIQHKEGKQNFATEADTESEERILSFIRKIYPNHGFLAEESGAHDLSSEIIWIIDPLDGTLNFARGIPQFSVSISACQGDEILTGVVIQPMLNELFVAEKGKGATLNGNPIRVSSIDSLDSALLASGFPYQIEKNPMETIDVFSYLLRKGSPIRRLGSAAIDLAYVAAGRFDAYFETGIKPWDVAAGILLVQEAGGQVTRWDASAYQVKSSYDILSSNKLLHPIMVQAIEKGQSSCK